jgi:anti-sigma factor RsiW
MSEHVLDWIGAYHDGELHGGRLRAVEAHLRVCAACQTELAALQALTVRLQAIPPRPARTPADQFVAQVGLRLATRPAPVAGRARLRQATGLWLPLGVLVLWAFGQAVLLVSGLALGIGSLPVSELVALPALPAAARALPLLVTLVSQPGWGAWLMLLAMNIYLTAAAAALVWGCLAGWWSASNTNFDTSLASSGRLAGG